MSHAYNVESQNVSKLFGAGAVYKMPQFQRRYAWTPNEVGAFFSDIFLDRLVESGEDEAYFLGSIVLAESDEGLLVLDGQQRLTTIALTLAVFRYELLKRGDSNARYLDKNLLLQEYGEDNSARVVLQEADAKDFVHLIENVEDCEAREFKRTTIALAMRTIRDSVRDALQGHGEEDARRMLGQMTTRLLKGVEVVRITAPSEASAFLLFETLNDRGLPLNAADLIKNKLLACSGEYFEETRALWGEIHDLIGAKDVITFLRHYWIAFKDSVKKDALYNSVKLSLACSKPKDVRKFVKHLREQAGVYRQLVEPEDSFWCERGAATLRRLSVFRATTCRPLLLLCASEERNSFPSIAQLCEVATVRHTFVSQLNPSKLDRLYLALCTELRDGEHDFVGKVATAVRGILPKDRDFEANFFAYETGAKVNRSERQLLLCLNEANSTGETVVCGPGKVHVEHILPKKPSKEALEEAGLDDQEAAEYSRKLGNLTLLSGKINQSISNGPFSKKRDALASSEIAMNREVVQKSKWGSAEIDARSERFAKLALSLWPWPAQGQEAEAAE
jgi:hypothetical protein